MHLNRLLRLFFVSIFALMVGVKAFGQEGNMILHTDNEKAKQLFFKALDMQRGRRFDLAITSLEDAIKKDKGFEEAYNLLVKNYEIFGLF